MRSRTFLAVINVTTLIECWLCIRDRNIYLYLGIKERNCVKNKMLNVLLYSIEHDQLLGISSIIYFKMYSNKV